MANTTIGKRRRGAWAGVLAGIALVVMLASVQVAAAQQPDQPARPPRVRLLLKSGLDHYKSGDYEGAAKFFNQVQQVQNELSPTERTDLKNFMQKNRDALTSQQTGHTQVRQANEALKTGNTLMARDLIKGLTANQYLAATDRQTLATLNANLRGGSAPPPALAQKGTEIIVENNEIALLAAGREALKRGDLDTAEALNIQANKLAPIIHSPWASDTPSKLRRDILAARARMEKRESTGIVKTVTNMFKKDVPMATEGPDGAPRMGPPLTPPALVKNGKPGMSSDGPGVRQTIYPGDGNPASSTANKVAARRLIKEAYKALEANDIDSARRLANQAKELSPDLEWWEENPNRLLDDIQRRAAAKGMSGANAGRLLAPGEARNLIKEARNLLQQDKIDDAEVLCMQAASSQPRGWGLFEDSPDKLRADIQKARGKRDRDEATKLLIEARKLYSLGNVQEAKAKATHAQKLHGPYSIWDMSDRPQKLLEEIHRAELKNPALAAPADLGGMADPKKAPRGMEFSAFGQSTKAGYTPPAFPNKGMPLLSGTAQAGAKIRAVALLQEARELQKKGMLIEARAKTIEADNLRVTFGPEEDNPASVLVSLAAQCERMVDQYLQRATDQVQNHPTDQTRFQKAQADINAARRFAQTFRLDNMRIEQKAQWLQQAAVSSGLQPIAAAGTPNDPQAVFQAGGLASAPPPALDSPAGRNRMLGMEKLDKARLELKAGNLALARRLAEDAYNPQYGIQEEAGLVLRSVDADDYNHRANLANRNADAGIEAYQRGDFRQAAGILNGIDVRLVQADKARRIGELMNTPQMQPQPLQLVEAKGPGQGPNPNFNAGTATATDLQPGDDLTKSFRAMEEVQFQQMRERGINAQKSAMELFKAGRKAQAVDALREYLDELSPTNFDAQRLALLKRPVESRMQQYRTVLAQEAIEKQVDSVGSHWDENRQQKSNRKTQDEVAEQIKQYRVLQKEGKYKEALAAARKAKELDPDNLAADAAIQITSIKIAQRDYDKGRDNNEEMFLKGLNPNNGPFVDTSNPLAFDPEALKRVHARESGRNGFPASPPRGPVERSIERRLDEPISLTFKDTPLQEAIEVLHSMSGINIIPDRGTLQEANISLDMPLSLAVEKISLRSALNLLLAQVKLTYDIKDQVLLITTKEKKQGGTFLVTYSVADLVVPVENHPTSGMNDINTALARHLAAASGVINTTASPVMSPTSLPNGAPISSQSSGLGSTFAMNASSMSAQNLVPTRAPGETIQDLLINLIQNTVGHDSWNSVGGQGTIQYYPLGMALVVNQTQEVQEDVAALLASLRRLQDLEIAIEMRLVSVSESFFERIGVDFNVNIKSPTSAANQVNLVNGQFTPFGQVNSQFQGIKAITGLTPAGTLTPDLGIPIRNSSFDFSVPPFGGYPGTLGADGGLSLGLAFLSDIQVFMFLEAAQGDRRLNVMQAPKLTVFNGQTANISVNDQQFFLTGVNINQANGQIFFSPNNQPFPLGVTMQVTPVVSADRRFVRLNLTPNLTNLASTNVPLIPVQIPVPQLLDGPGNGSSAIGQPVIFQMFFQQPTFTTISLDTTVNVPDGGTVLLGGLKTMSEGRNEFGPPILSKIPYLSRLFKNVAYGRDGQSLMIMVTPRIIINEEEEQIFTGFAPQIPRN